MNEEKPDRRIMHHLIEGNEDEVVPLTLKYYSNGYSWWHKVKAWFGRRLRRFRK